MKPTNKLTAPIGSLAFVLWPDVTSWVLCGWSIFEIRFGGAVMVKRG